MTDSFPYFKRGRNIVLRTIWNGKIWSAGPQIVVQDTPELLALYIYPGAFCWLPRALDGGRVKPRLKANGEYMVKETVWDTFSCLRLKIPGSDYSVEIFRRADGSFRAWYINMETPLTRTPIGFDYTDEELDALVLRDRSAWYLKDEDEMAEAVAYGLISPERAAYLHTEGEHIANWIQSGQSPFNLWESWRPDPAWDIPVLPEGWDKV